MHKIILLFACLLSVNTLSSQSIVGLWKTIDDNDGKAKSYMKIYEQDGKIYGKVDELISTELTICKKCKDDRKNQPIEGMVIIWDMSLEIEGESEGGEIIDPKSGKVYKCKLKVDGDDKLEVRGYIGVPMFGRSQTWYRMDE